jgi:hypothetical protein
LDCRHVRFGSKADIRAAKCHIRFTPESGHVRCNQDIRYLFDHFISAGKQGSWHCDAQRFGGLHINHGLELGRCLYW